MINTMIRLTEVIRALDDEQYWLDALCAFELKTQEHQLRLDRVQTELDSRRAFFMNLIENIARNN